MASPKTIMMQKSIPVPHPVMYKVGNAKVQTFRPRGKKNVRGAFGNGSVRSIPFGYGEEVGV